MNKKRYRDTRHQGDWSASSAGSISYNTFVEWHEVSWSSVSRWCKSAISRRPARNWRQAMHLFIKKARSSC